MNEFYYQPSPNQLILWSYEQRNAQLKPVQREKLREVFSGWRGLLLREEAIIQITGHSGPGEDNCQDVSAERNQGVYLILCAHGCDGRKIYRKAVGNSYPLDSALLNRWRERNRRVELTLIKVVDQSQKTKERGLSAKQSEPTFPKSAKGHAELERELAWEEEHPQGEVLEEEAQDKYILWNFGVGERTLKAEHRQELIRILTRITPRTKILVDGHVSKNEALQDGDNLAAMRAAEVCEFLLRFRIRQDNIITTFHGANKPLFPNLSGSNMARNRRVEVMLLQAKAKKETANEKALPNITVEEQMRKDADDQGPAFPDFKLKELIPNKTYNLEYSLPMYPLLHSIFEVHPFIQFEGIVQIETESLLGFEIGRDFNEQLGIALKHKLDEYNEFEIGTDGKISLENEKLLFSPEIQTTLFDLDGKGIKEPFCIILTLMDLPLGDVKLWEGITGKGTIKVKMKFVFRPNLKLIGQKALEAALKLGASGTLTVVLIGGAVYMTLKLPVIIEEATDKKIKEHKANAMLEGYAYRLTMELIDSSWQKYLKEYMESIYVSTAYGAYEDCQKGWQKAAVFLANLAENGQLEEFLKKMIVCYPQKYAIDLKDEIYRKLKTLYNYETEVMPHPYELCF